MVRLATILVLGSALMATRTAAQLPQASVPSVSAEPQGSGTVRWGRSPQWLKASIVPQDSSLPRILPFSEADTASTPRHKSPFLAWFLSWLVPGGGQGYNGQWGKAAAFFVPAAVGFGLVVANDGFSCNTDCGTRDVGLVVLAVSSVASQIEAPIAASKINREARKTSPSQVGLIIASIDF